MRNKLIKIIMMLFLLIAFTLAIAGSILIDNFPNSQTLKYLVPISTIIVGAIGGFGTLQWYLEQSKKGLKIAKNVNKKRIEKKIILSPAQKQKFKKIKKDLTKRIELDRKMLSHDNLIKMKKKLSHKKVNQNWIQHSNDLNVIIKNIIVHYGVSEDEQKMFYSYLLQKKGYKAIPVDSKKSLVFKGGRWSND